MLGLKTLSAFYAEMADMRWCQEKSKCRARQPHALKYKASLGVTDESRLGSLAVN
jgi:hypothetical protein